MVVDLTRPAEPEPDVFELSWPELTSLMDSLADAVLRDGRPEVVVGVLRGGAVPAVMAAHRLDVRSVRMIDVQCTTTDDVNATKLTHPAVTNPASLGDVAGTNVLVVDDIVGSGATLATTTSLLRAVGAVRVRSAVGVLNERNWNRANGASRDDAGNGSVELPTYVGMRCATWVIFPWEKSGATP